jgi:two-component system sensor histidine kinase/response regulator
MSTDLAHILYVDDEEHNLTAFRASFRRDFVVHTAISAAAGEALLDEHPIEVIVTDQRMPDVTGVQFLERIRQLHPNPIRIVLTGFADIEAIVDAINRGQVYRYISKPWEQQDIKMVLDAAVDMFRLRQENTRLMEHLARYNEELEATVKLRTAELQRKSSELEDSNRSVVEQNKIITKLNKDKARVLALAGEDLQHPIADILKTAAHGIKRADKLSSNEAVTHLHNIATSASHVKAVLDNLLHLNAIENTGISVYPTRLDPNMVVQVVAMEFQERARAKNITLTYERTGSISMCHTDPRGVQTIAEHLVSNAVKFTPPGGSVAVTLQSVEGGICLRVADSGPGFTNEDKQHLYTSFTPHSAKPTGGELSTGLGLSITKQYVQALKGTIELTSMPGSGATFIVTLPGL